MSRRVAHLTFDMRVGGAERVVRTLVRRADPTRFESLLLCLEHELGPFGADLKEAGVPVTCLGRRPGFDWAAVRGVRGFLRRHRVDVLHCHQYSPWVYGVLGALGTGARVIFTEHGRLHPDLPRPRRRLINPWLVRLTRHVTAISQATRDALVEVENFPTRRVEVVYNGIEEETVDVGARERVRRGLGIPAGAPVLGTVARLDPIKNQAMMVRTLALVRARFPDTRLLLVGDGPERADLEAFAADAGLGGAVHFTGFRQDVPQLLAAMDLFLLTSHTEGTAMTLLEAMARSLPCLGTDVGGNPEIVTDGETGYLVPVNDDAGLSERVGALLADRVRLAEMGRAARRRFEERFTAAAMVGRYQALYG